MHGKVNDSWSRPLRSAVEGPLGGLIIYGLLALLLIAGLLLPPISLARRIPSFGYARVPPKEGGYVATEDGTYVIFPPEGIQGRTKVKLTAIPRGSFLEGSADKDLLKAAENIPAWLIMKSDYYRIQFRGQGPPTRVMLRIPIPADAQPLRTLDLYAWNGAAWEWLPHSVPPGGDLIPPGGDYIEAELDYLPQSVVVMQTKTLQPSVSADLEPAADVPAQAQNTIAEINPQGLYLDAEGAIRGDPGALPRPDQAAIYSVVPSLRNWEEDAPPRSDLLDNMLIDQADREAHIQRIVELVVNNAYPGVEVDYRGASPDLRAEYTEFITGLAEALHEQGKRLSVRLEPPAQVAPDHWETDAYDWRAIGAVVDTLEIPAPNQPGAYTPGGQMDAMLQWAVGEVNRYKLGLSISTHSTEQVNGNRRGVPYAEALTPFSQVVVEGGTSVVNPGQNVTFILTTPGQSTAIQFDPNSGMYWFAYVDSGGKQREVWLENGASVARKLRYVATYNLRGAAVQNLLGEENDSQIWEAIPHFVDLVIPPVENHLQVVWHVESASGKLIAQAITDLADPRYQWTAPAEAGEYRIRALISSDGGATGIVRGGISVVVDLDRAQESGGHTDQE